MKVAELLRLIKLAQEGKIIVRHTTREVSGVTASDGYVSHRFEEVDIMEMDIKDLVETTKHGIGPYGGTETVEYGLLTEMVKKANEYNEKITKCSK